MNRDKTEQVFFEDAIGCTIDQAYQDMVATKKRFHKTDKVQGFHLVQSFAEGEVSPELAHLIGVLWSSIFVTLMANKIGGLQFGIYRNCQISSRVFHTAVAALPLTKANRSDFE